MTQTPLRRWLAVILLGSWLASPARADDFPNPPDTERNPGQPPSPEEALKVLRLPEGFRATVFAAEPDVRNPIALDWDGRGRLWIAENYTYAARADKFDLKLRDRVIIFEDRDGDGKADTRKVFTDGVQRLSSVATAPGGVWLLCPPQLLFVPDRDGDDVPDGAAEVVLDGFEVPPENYHGFANGLKWGPDGWLYGRCGASAPGELGVPGTLAADRVPVRGGLWRYHPTKKHVEALTHGTTNPWGHDWNDLGEAFFINTVNGHLWHAVAGAHLVRPHTVDPNPYAYELIDQHADHWHWDVAKDWTDSRSASGEHDRRGGGHAHSGMMIYQGDDWPAPYQGGLFTLNLHGRRVNFDAIERQGDGYVGKHRPDPILAGDPWFRGIDLGTGPDGGVFVLDWSDTGECHEQTGVHRSSGRIYKITYGEPSKVAALDLNREPSVALVDRLDHPNAWYARKARVVLATRQARGDALPGVRQRLLARLGGTDDPARVLANLWTWHAIGGVDRPLLRSLVHHPQEAVRAWAVRLLTDDLPLDTVYGKRPGGRPDPGLSREELSLLADVAQNDGSGLVRLILASTLQRLPHAQRPALAGALLARSEDAHDHDVPLMLWYALMPLADTNPAGLATLGARCALPTTRRLIARRLAEEIDGSPGPLNGLLSGVARDGDDAACLDVLAGLSEGLRGRRKASVPQAWSALASRVDSIAEARDRVRDLNVLFGDGRALEDVRRVALDEKAEISARRSALESLIAAEPPDLQ
ncbi:MAG: PVC-type heme-binding CxxCH protein, partial [Isosphaeraceae bacterium]